MKNKPLSAYKKKKLIESFCDELTATQAAHRLNLDRNTVNKYFKRIRECIAGYREYAKMKLMIQAMSSPDVQVQAISKMLAPTHSVDAGIPVRIMCIDGQLLTDVQTHTNGNGSKYMMNVSGYFSNEPVLIGNGQSAISNKPNTALLSTNVAMSNSQGSATPSADEVAFGRRSAPSTNEVAFGRRSALTNRMATSVEHMQEVNVNAAQHDCGNLETLAEEFHAFTTSRFKKFFGIKNEYAYLYIKEAEFVFNEKNYSQREHLLNLMTEKIFQ